MTSTLPKIHQTMLEQVQNKVAADQRFLALLAGGSYLHGGFDAHSDLDLVIVVNGSDYDAVMKTRKEFAASIGSLLAAFTGEHVGEPRLLICLYGPDLSGPADPTALLHVDLKFVTLHGLGDMVETPAIVWSRDTRAETAIAQANVRWPNMPPGWFEDRFWIWVHYGATKLARGELYEAMGMLGFLREQVLGPLVHARGGRPQRGIRRVEEASPEWAVRLRATVPDHSADAVLASLKAAIAIYRELREPAGIASPAEAPVTAFIGNL